MKKVWVVLSLVSVAALGWLGLQLWGWSETNRATLWVAAGDVTQNSVVLWAHSITPGTLTVLLQDENSQVAQPLTATVLAAMIPVTLPVDNLTPAAHYAYRVQATHGATVSGHFRTPAGATRHAGLRFGVSGDWRASLAPFVAVGNAADRQLDFFVELGDTIYADLASPALPKSHAETLAEFRIKHNEVYSPHFGLNPLADLRAATAIFATIDDHEVTNDFAGGAAAKLDPRFQSSVGRINQTAIYANALQAFVEYNPLHQEFYAQESGDERFQGARKLYRYRRFGQDAAIFLLDTRSFRDLPIHSADRNDPADIVRFRKDSFRPGRTLLGSQQLAELKADLLDAEQQGITWKIILIPEPIQQRGLMSAQDRFEGYATERADLLQFIEEQALRNVLFIAADIHGTLVNNLSYSTSPDAAQIATHAFEVTVGPVAYYQTLGEVVISDGLQKGYVSAEEQQRYLALPIAPDTDSVVNDRDDFVKAILDQELLASALDPLGLEGSPIQAHLLTGDYVALHSYGWSEFMIDAATQRLTITTWGIPPYTEQDLQTERWVILARQPQIVSQFEVAPQ